MLTRFSTIVLLAVAVFSTGCASQPDPAPAVTDNSGPSRLPSKTPAGTVYSPDEVVSLLEVPEKVGKLELEYVFRYTDASEGDLYLYGGDVLMRPEIGILPFDARLEALVKSEQRKKALQVIYEGLRRQLTADPGMAAPESMQVVGVEFLREEMREATWIRRNRDGEAVGEETLPAILAVYDLKFADGSDARSYFWLTAFSGHILRIKMTEIPYPGLDENFISFARQVMTSVFRGSTAHLVEKP